MMKRLLAILMESGNFKQKKVNFDYWPKLISKGEECHLLL